MLGAAGPARSWARAATAAAAAAARWSVRPQVGCAWSSSSPWPSPRWMAFATVAAAAAASRRLPDPRHGQRADAFIGGGTRRSPWTVAMGARAAGITTTPASLSSPSDRGGRPSAETATASAPPPSLTPDAAAPLLTPPSSPTPSASPSSTSSASASSAPAARSWRDRLLPQHPGPTTFLTLPNLITLARLVVMTPVLGYLIVHHYHVAAFVTLAATALTDWIDGWMARRYHCQTVVGSVLDPLADKVLMTVLTATLMSAGLVPLPLGALILARDASLMLAAAVMRYRHLPPPRSLKAYVDLAGHPATEIRPPFSSKLNTALQLVLMTSSLAAPVWNAAWLASAPMLGLQAAVAATTLVSWVEYLVRRDLTRRVHPKR